MSGNKLVFTGPEDTDDIYGKLEFGANGLEYVGDARGLPPDMGFPYPIPQADGSYDVYSVSASRNKPWRIIRCRTVDGLNFENAEVVYESRPGAWVGYSTISYNPRDKQIIVWRYEAEAPSHALRGYGSKDGRQWTLISTKPAYHDHDAMTMRWDSRAERYVAYQNTMQKWERRYGDNVGNKVRRVLSIRTSPDGIAWTPGTDAGYEAGPFTAEEYCITPDGDDPVDLQFYLFRSFPYADRYAGMMLNYAPSPQCVNPSAPQSLHGPSLSGEWLVSGDGLKWRRPYRDIFAPGEGPSFIWHEPMVLRRKMLWIMDDKVYGLPQDRLFYAGSLCNAEFTTRAFTMPGTSWLMLNAALGVRGVKQAESWARQGYIMVELLDINGRVIQGYEKEKCIIRQSAAAPKALSWGSLTGGERAGDLVRLRFYLRDARIYSVGL